MDQSKVKRLNAVFLKAIDSATDSVTPAELKDCFKDSNAVSSTAVENLFVNSIGKVKNSIESRFDARCKAPIAEDTGSAVGSDAMPSSESVAKELQSFEEQTLREAIAQLEGEVTGLRQRLAAVHSELSGSVIPQAQAHQQRLAQCNAMAVAGGATGAASS